MLKSPVFLNVIKVASGTAMSQILIFVFTPFLTRLYSIEDLGVQSLFVSYVGVLSALSTLSYHMAIVLPKKDKTVSYLVLISLVCIFGLFLLLLIIAGLFLSIGDAESSIKLSYQYVLLIPVAVTSQGVFFILSQCMVREKRFSMIAQNCAEQALFSCVAKTSLGIIYPSAITLVISNIFSVVYASLRLYTKVKKYFFISFMKDIFSKRNALFVAKKFRDFPVYRTPQVVVAAISFGAPAVILSFYFGAREVGLYAVAASLVSAPVVLLGGGVLPVFYQRFNEIKEDAVAARRLLWKATLVMFLLGVSQFVFFACIDYSFYEFIFGAGWAGVGDYALFLSVWAVFQLANRPAVAAIPVLGKQKLLLAWEIFSSGTRILGLVIGGAYFNSANFAIGLFSIVGAITYLFLIVGVFRVSK